MKLIVKFEKGSDYILNLTSFRSLESYNEPSNSIKSYVQCCTDNQEPNIVKSGSEANVDTVSRTKSDVPIFESFERSLPPPCVVWESTLYCNKWYEFNFYRLKQFTLLVSCHVCNFSFKYAFRGLSNFFSIFKIQFTTSS